MSAGSAAWSRLHQLTGVMRPGGLSLTQRALDFCALPSGARALDVGCGAGATVEYLRQRDLAVVGVDASEQFLRSGRQGNSRLSLVLARGERLPLASGTQDLVLAECSLSTMHMDEALGEFARVLKPGGKLVLSDLYLRGPEGASALRRLAPGGCLAGAWSRGELGERLAAHGFCALLWEDHSAALRQLAAQWIMSGGSPEEFWCQGSCVAVQASHEEIRQALSVARPGYFLLVAEHWRLAGCSSILSNWGNP